MTATNSPTEELTADAQQAGFSSVEVLPIEGFSFFRFYRLNH